ncbi:MAG: LysE family transporter [Rhizobiales bacterium]|nr:LysE family transporter [Hyphomicrobiales bacterium]
MIEFESIAAIALAFFIVTVSPGPANIAVATVAMSSGRPGGLLFGLGLSVGLAFWGVVAATGMGAVLQGASHLLIALKIAGGLYLLWLALQSARSAIKPSGSASAKSYRGRWFTRGLILNLSNPKAVVAWMAALSMGLGSGDNATAVVTALLVCVALGFVNYAGYALVFSISGVMSGYSRARRWIDGVVAGLFALAGFGLLRAAFSR